jgi:hypothetical protein
MAGKEVSFEKEKRKEGKHPADIWWVQIHSGDRREETLPHPLTGLCWHLAKHMKAALVALKLSLHSFFLSVPL